MVNIQGFRRNTVENADNMSCPVAAMVIGQQAAFQKISAMVGITIVGSVSQGGIGKHYIGYSNIVTKGHCRMFVPGEGRPCAERCQQ